MDRAFLFDANAALEPTRSALVAAGWSPNRYVDMSLQSEDFARWGVPMHTCARRILEQLYGLKIEPFVLEGENYSVDSLDFNPNAAAEMDVILELNHLFGDDFFPVALMYVSGIYVSAAGVTVCSQQDEFWKVGDKFSESLDRLICAEGEIERFDRL
ncbi:SUKH-3 domain-containing protein [Streptacidiphilus sp. PAMC 29251]